MPKNLGAVRNWVRAVQAGRAPPSMKIICPRCDRVGVATVDPEATLESKSGPLFVITWRYGGYFWLEKHVTPGELIDPDLGCGFDKRGRDGTSYGADPAEDGFGTPEANC